MTQTGPTTLRTVIEGPYVAEARQIEFEIATTRYEPDEFSFDGAALVKRDERFVLNVARASELQSRQGRRVRVSAQSNAVGANRNISLQVEVLDEWPEWSREPARVALPNVESLGISQVFVVARWANQPALGGGTAAGILGAPVRLTPAAALPAVRVGPIGRLRVLLPPRTRPEPRVERLAIPVEASR